MLEVCFSDSMKDSLRYAQHWQKLKAENASLRALVSGRSIKIAALIGNVLGKYRLGIGEWQIAERICDLLRTGELRMVQEDAEQFYHCAICGEAATPLRTARQ